MDYELLQHKAKQICDKDKCKGSLEMNRLKDGMWIMPSYNFTCSGNMTSLLLGGDMRLNKADYPTISLWSRQGESTVYNKVSGSDRTLSLGSYNFSTSGPLLYHLSEPLQFESGQVFGLRHYDDSGILRLYYIDSNQSMIYKFKNDFTNFNTINTSQGNNVNNVEHKQVLIYSKTSKYLLIRLNITCSLFLDTPQCINGFPNKTTVITKSKDITNVITYQDNARRYIPDLHVICDGHVTHIIVGGRNGTGSNEPNIQLWRSLGNNNYQQVLDYNITISSQYYSISTNLYQYNLSTPVPVQSGDFLSIYQPSNGHFILYQQKLNGPKNYWPNGTLLNNNNYPLISLSVGKRNIFMLLKLSN